MCGIIGWISCKEESLEVLFDRLRTLLNRGYDSVGVGVLTHSCFHISKTTAINKKWDQIRSEINHRLDLRTHVQNVMMHTRWATHGGITDTNAHPHVSTDGNIMLVHNGIIDNYQELKNELIQHDIVNPSETDSSVVADAIAHLMQINQTLSFYDAVKKIVHRLRGSWAFIIMCRSEPDVTIVVRKGSPVVLGMTKNDDALMIVSEKSAFLPSIYKKHVMDNNKIITIRSSNNNKIFVDTSIEFDTIDIDDPFFCVANSPSPFPYWTLSEIWQQPNQSKYLIDQLKIIDIPYRLTINDRIIMFGCGTSYHANLLIKDFCESHFMEDLQMKCIDIASYDASGFDVSRLKRIRGKTYVICSSQSGETIDLYNSIVSLKEKIHDCILGGLINVPESLLDRLVDFGIYVRAGKENGVASTKSYTNTVLAGIYMIMKILGVSPTQQESILGSMAVFPDQIQYFLPRIEDFVRNTIVPSLDSIENMFVIGSKLDYCVALENALKIKEICYIHCEASQMCSLKHGPFAMLSEQFPVLLLNTDSINFLKAYNAYQEIIARKAPVFVVSTTPFTNESKNELVLPQSMFSFLTANIVGQCIAYYVAIGRGIDPDFPRNLAKVVTVE